MLTVLDFMDITSEDYKAPTTSVFCTRMAHCRNTVATLEEVKHLYNANKADVQYNLQTKHNYELYISNCITESVLSNFRTLVQ